MQILAHLRDKKRDRVLLNAELVELLTEESERQSSHLEIVRQKLRDCLQKLSQDNRRLVDLRYTNALPIVEIAERLNRSVSAVKVSLMRNRRSLADCIDRGLAAEELS